MSKKMPSETRISNMLPGDNKVIVNDHGTYILVRVPMRKDETTYFEHPDHKVSVESMQNALDSISDGVNEAEQEKHTSLISHEETT